MDDWCGGGSGNAERSDLSDLWRFEFCRRIDPRADYQTKVWLERVIIAGLQRVPKSATLVVNKQVVGELEVIPSGSFVTVRKPGINIAENWSIELKF